MSTKIPQENQPVRVCFFVWGFENGKTMVKTRHFYIHLATGNQQQKIEYLAHRASRGFFYA
ncbi:hypothetical protein [Yersinia rohdei]|uniref:hypothetical protein n=1 Tax=Yersinia rohdei TaxID=29485 RepID=UPI0006D42471|nr:hypothetical protein [Yersinia rohdei]